MIGITGSTGVLGGALLDSLQKLNLRVVPIQRNSPLNQGDFNWNLDNPVPDSFLKFDMIINCAYSFDVSRQEKFDIANSNIEGARKLAEWGRENHVKIINPSSVNAVLGMTKYGREKAIIEEIFSQNGHYNLRLGILDTNPPIGLLAELLAKPKYLPRLLVDKHKAFLVSDIDKLSLLIRELYCEEFHLDNKNIYVINKNKETLPDLLAKLKPESKFMFVNLKSRLLLLVLNLLRANSKAALKLYDQVLAVSIADSMSIEESGKGWIFI